MGSTIGSILLFCKNRAQKYPDKQGCSFVVNYIMHITIFDPKELIKQCLRFEHASWVKILNPMPYGQDANVSVFMWLTELVQTGR